MYIIQVKVSSFSYYVKRELTNKGNCIGFTLQGLQDNATKFDNTHDAELFCRIWKIKNYELIKF